MHLQGEDAAEDGVHRPMFSAAALKSHGVGGTPSGIPPANETLRQAPISEAELVPMGGMPIMPYALHFQTSMLLWSCSSAACKYVHYNTHGQLVHHAVCSSSPNPSMLL